VVFCLSTIRPLPQQPLIDVHEIQRFPSEITIGISLSERQNVYFTVTSQYQCRYYGKYHWASGDDK